MKIDNSVKSLSGGSVSDIRNAKKGPAAVGDTPSTDSANVQLSSLSSSAQSVGSSLSGSEGVVDAAQVAEIKQAIAEGKFQINPGAIADRLLESVKELMGNPK